jgi:hypothetical protein
MCAKAKGIEAAQLVAKKIDESMRSGKSAEDAIKETTAAYGNGGKVERLKILPAPALAAADGGANDVASKAAVGDAGAPPGKATALPDKRFDPGTDPDHPQVQTSTAFNRGGDPFAGLSPDGTSSVIAFAFSGKEGDVIADPVRIPDGFVVVQLKQHKVATRAEFDKDRETFEQELVRAKRDEALSLYVKRLRQQGKDDIKIDQSYVQEAKVDGGVGGANEDEDEY